MRNYNSKFKIFKFFIFFFIFSFLILNFALTPMTQAAQDQLVPCGPGTAKPSCNFCDLLTLAKNVINFALYYIAVPLVVIFIIYGGFVILTAGDKPERVSDGKKIITSAVIGLLIALLSWTLIDIIINVLAPGRINQWWNPAAKIGC